MNKPFPTLPASWSDLTWQQLQDCWQIKQRYGGNPDVARAAAVLTLTFGSRFKVLGQAKRQSRAQGSRVDDRTGEPVYYLTDGEGNVFATTPRQLAWMAKEALPWFDYPYGDPGKEAVKDEKGNVIEEAVAPVRGYVSNMRDALILQEEEVTLVNGSKLMVKGGKKPLISYLLPLTSKHFALPQLACNNLTWQQYRSLQAIAPQLFKEGNTEDETLDLWAQFLAHCLVPRSLALLDTNGGSIRFRPHWEYTYDAMRAEGMVSWWRRRMGQPQVPILFHICFQAYQTALTYYAQAYPLLFNGSDKGDKMRDALQGEVGTINTIMKYAGYSEQQQVYDSNLPFVLDILNTMAKEAKEIEKMNAKIKRK